MDKTERLKKAIENDSIRIKCEWRARRPSRVDYHNDYYFVYVFDGDDLILAPEDLHERFRKDFLWGRGASTKYQILMGGGNYSKPLDIAIEILYTLWREFGIEKDFMKRGVLPGRYLEEV